MSNQLPDPLRRPVHYPPIDNHLYTLMTKAAVEASSRIGVVDPRPTLSELRRFRDAFAAPVACLGEYHWTPEPRIRWARSGAMIDESRIHIDTQAQRDGALLTGTLWAAMRAVGGPRLADHTPHLFTGILDPGWLAWLPTAQGTTEGVDDLQARHGWALLTCRWLAALSGSKQNVLCLYDFQETDERASTPHWDSWYGAVIQLAGRTAWWLGDDTGPDGPTAAVTNPGDLLLIPEGLRYLPAAFPDSGGSMRVLFALCRRELAD